MVAVNYVTSGCSSSKAAPGVMQELHTGGKTLL